MLGMLKNSILFVEIAHLLGSGGNGINFNFLRMEPFPKLCPLLNVKLDY